MTAVRTVSVPGVGGQPDEVQRLMALRIEQLEDVERDLREKIAELEEQIASQRGEILQLEGEIQDAEEEIAELSLDMDDLNLAVDDLCALRSAARAGDMRRVVDLATRMLDAADTCWRTRAAA